MAIISKQPKNVRQQFLEFLVFMGSFYEASLENLKNSLEK